MTPFSRGGARFHFSPQIEALLRSAFFGVFFLPRAFFGGMSVGPPSDDLVPKLISAQVDSHRENTGGVTGSTSGRAILSRL